MSKIAIDTKHVKLLAASIVSIILTALVLRELRVHVITWIGCFGMFFYIIIVMLWTMVPGENDDIAFLRRGIAEERRTWCHRAIVLLDEAIAKKQLSQEEREECQMGIKMLQQAIASDELGADHVYDFFSSDEMLRYEDLYGQTKHRCDYWLHLTPAQRENRLAVCLLTRKMLGEGNAKNVEEALGLAHQSHMSRLKGNCGSGPQAATEPVEYAEAPGGKYTSPGHTGS